MTSTGDTRDALRAALTAAMKERDRAAVAVFRTALAAIDNAGAVDRGDRPAAGAVEAAPVGVGATETARRDLTEDEVLAIVRAEVDERRAAAEVVGPETGAGGRLLHEATVLAGVIGQRPA